MNLNILVFYALSLLFFPNYIFAAASGIKTIEVGYPLGFIDGRLAGSDSSEKCTCKSIAYFVCECNAGRERYCILFQVPADITETDFGKFIAGQRIFVKLERMSNEFCESGGKTQDEVFAFTSSFISEHAYEMCEAVPCIKSISHAVMTHS